MTVYRPETFPSKAVRVRLANLAKRKAAEARAAKRRALAEQRAARQHANDPDVKRYRTEAAKAVRRTAQRVEEAMREFERWLAAEALRQKGGRPPSRTGKHRGPNINVGRASPTPGMAS